MELSGADQMMTITETGECELNGFMSCICYFIYYYNTEANELVSYISRGFKTVLKRENIH